MLEYCYVFFEYGSFYIFRHFRVSFPTRQFPIYLHRLTKYILSYFILTDRPTNTQTLMNYSKRNIENWSKTYHNSYFFGWNADGVLQSTSTKWWTRDCTESAILSVSRRLSKSFGNVFYLSSITSFNVLCFMMIVMRYFRTRKGRSVGN